MRTDNFYREKPKEIYEGDIDDTPGLTKHTDFGCELGKIESIEFGKVGDYPFLLGLKIGFSGDGTGCCIDFTMNMNDHCNWKYPTERQKYAEKIMQLVCDLLEDAKKNDVSELIGTPVEMYFNMKTCFVLGVLIGFRVLKEVL